MLPLNWNSELLVSDPLQFLSETVTSNIQDGGYFLRDCNEQSYMQLMDM